MKLSILLLATAALAALPYAAAAQPIEPGLWEVTVTMQAPGATQPQQHTTQRCYSKQELGDPQHVVPATGMGAQCKMLNSNQSGNRFTYTMQCDQPKLVSSGEFSFAGTSYDGRLDTEISDPAIGTMRLAQQISARRVGDCK